MLGPVIYADLDFSTVASEVIKMKTLGIALTFLIACVFFKSIPTVEFVKT